MKSHIPFDLNIPVLYINPPLNADPSLVEAVSRSGGLGIVDHVTAGRSDLQISPGSGSRRARAARGCVDVSDAEQRTADRAPSGRRGRIVFAGTWSAQKLACAGFRGGRQCGSSGPGREGRRCRDLLPRDMKAPGWVSETCGFVLLQEILNSS